MIRKSIAGMILLVAVATPCLAEDSDWTIGQSATDDAIISANGDAASDRLLILNGNTRRVIYDDHRDDLFCVTRLYAVGWNHYGHRVYRRTMACR